MRRRDAWVLGLLTVQTLLFWGTLYWPGLGVPVWHHFASLGVVLVGTLLYRRPFLHSRRFLAIGVLSFSVLATLSGFWLLYWKEGIRVGGYQDWGVFWHVLWSWAAAVFFVMHTWINRAAFVHFLQRSVATRPARLLHIGLYLLVLVALVVTWGPGRGWFTNENYLALGFYAWLVSTIPPYVVWGLVRARVATGTSAGWPQRLFHHWRVRRLVDLSLVPIAALVVLSGIVLTFFDPLTDRLGLKYASKYWHVWPSVVFSMLVFVHGVQAWPTVRAHWRKYTTAAPGS